MTSNSWDALVLAGGTSSRMKQDKATLEIDHTSFLQRTVDALGDASTIIVSGNKQPLSQQVKWCLEDPPLSGPVAAIAEAVKYVESEWVLILPCDLAHPAEAIEWLSNSERDSSFLVARDHHGHNQWLTTLAKTDALRAALAKLDSKDVPVRALFTEANITFVDAPPQSPHIWEDMDTPEDLLKARKEPS